MKKHELDPSTMVDVVFYRKTDYQDALRLKKEGEKRGWTVKIGEADYLKKGNKI
ncbi:hypothetical protein [Flagellimonas flava]|uniref:hypothetical protein n=1 Tax=Flagellimonas flava TaxID=570519 RepID=UPI003D6467AA